MFFDSKPDRDTCSAMRHGGFRWAPSVGAWQRQLNANTFYAADHLDCLRPLSGVLPSKLQKEAAEEPAQVEPGWRFYIIADLKTWADNAENPSPLEWFDSFEVAKTRFEELRGEGYNSEAAEPGPDGLPPARLTLGLMSGDGGAAADILHVRQGQNWLVTDFTWSEQIRDDPQAMDILARVSKEIGFDLVAVREQAGEDRQALSTVPFAEWDNPYFPSGTPGRIAALYYELMNASDPNPRDGAFRKASIRDTVLYLQRNAQDAADRMFLAAAFRSLGPDDGAAAQELSDRLFQELGEYQDRLRGIAPRVKAPHKKEQER